jgi:Tc5 transposase DNA-binding domain
LITCPRQSALKKLSKYVDRTCRLTARKAGKIYNVVHSTILQRLRELHKPKKVGSQSRQLLTPVEERTIVKFVKQYYKWGPPLNLKQVRQFAAEILQRRSEPQNSVPYIEENWHRKFLARNPEIKCVVARGLDRTRAELILKIATFTERFELFSPLQQQYNIAPVDVYNMDEKGFCMGAIQRSHVLIPVHEREAFLRQNGSREWISVIECISGAGKSLPS